MADNEGGTVARLSLCFRRRRFIKFMIRLTAHRSPTNLTAWLQLLGINIFTYVLAGAIAFFLSMNTIYGSGWLGGRIGIPGTGTFVEQSASLPATIDLSRPEYQIRVD